MSGNTGDAFTYCLDDGSYSYTYSCSSYCTEHSWSVTDADGNVLSSGAGNYDGDQTLSFIVGGPPPVYGCTDSTATNYNSDATDDDSSCTYVGDSCSDPIDGAGSGSIDSYGATWHSVTLAAGLSSATFDLCGSNFDTKIYLSEAKNLEIIANLKEKYLLNISTIKIQRNSKLD